MRNFIFLALLSTISLSQCKSSKNAGSDNIAAQGVNFLKTETLSEVLELAARENKIVFVDFYATWCLPCRRMDEDVFSDKGIGEFMNENFINYKVDAEKGNGPELAAVYNVQAYPTLLFLDQKGRILERKIGATFHAQLKRIGKRALSSQR